MKIKSFTVHLDYPHIIGSLVIEADSASVLYEADGKMVEPILQLSLNGISVASFMLRRVIYWKCN